MEERSPSILRRCLRYLAINLSVTLRSVGLTATALVALSSMLVIHRRSHMIAMWPLLIIHSGKMKRLVKEAPSDTRMPTLRTKV